VAFPCLRDGRTSVYLASSGVRLRDSLFFLSLSLPSFLFHDFQPRLSYFGVQIAVAVYLIHLNSFDRAFALGSQRSCRRQSWLD